MVAGRILDIANALYRYALIPWKRLRPDDKPLRILLSRRTPADILEKYFPDERVLSFKGTFSKWEFHTKCVPWLLSDRRVGIFHTGNRLPGFVRAFCRRRNIPIENIARTRPAAYTAAVLAQGRPVFMYMPWAPEHDDALIDRVRSDAYELLAFERPKDAGGKEALSHLALFDPDLCRKRIMRKLIPLRPILSGIVLTSDRAPVMRSLVEACRSLGLPTFLLPQEAASVDAEDYYRDPETGASLPVCDVTLAWQQRQKEIFLARGYPPERIGVADAPDGNPSGIRDTLTNVANGLVRIEPMPSAREKLQRGQVIDVAAIASSEDVLQTIQCFLPQLLDVRTLKSSLTQDMAAMAAVEMFFQWGVKRTEAKDGQRSLARRLRRPLTVIEDGFIRSMKIGLSGEPGLSVIVDDTTSYYDATRQSGLERALEEGRDLTQAERRRALLAIRQIVDKRVSKYNHAPDAPIAVGRDSKPKVLVVDQRRGDQSIRSGLADEGSFATMLLDAISMHPDHDILVKVHPDAIIGGKAGYYTGDLPYLPEEARSRVFLLSNDVNPFVLIDLVKAVFVVSSGMGFEALMAGKPVHCYGVPFYSGWGATIDHKPMDRRTRRRSVEEIFHFAYIEASRYVHPETGKRIEVEELVALIAERAGRAG